MNNAKKKYDLITAVAVMAVVNILVITGMYFHEPWFDEAQAYLIARDASLHDIVMRWTHYEGHPPFWHLLLRGAITIGLSFETALRIVNMFFVEAMLILIEFKSPFSRITKIVIPTSYYLLFQYSVTSRPYMMLVFFSLLAASFYKDRDKKPLRYCIALLLMCFTHSFGIALAGGIVIADMSGEAIRERSFVKMAGKIINNKKLLFSYIFLLAGALAIIAVIIPHSDTFATNSSRKAVHGIAFCYFLSWFFIPSETIATSFSSELMCIKDEINPVNEIIAAAVVSLIIWAILFFIAKNRKMIAEVFIPYAIIAFITALYIAPHHFGIFLIYLLFMIWTASDKEKITLKEFTVPLEKAGIKQELSKKIAAVGVAAVSAINLYWTGLSYYRDIKYPFDPAKGFAQWIKDNELEESKFLTTWSEDDIHIVNASSVAANAFFDKNIYYNLNYGMTFITHIVVDEDEVIKEKNEWKEVGEPDFMICDSPQETKSICEEMDYESSYIALAYEGKGKRIFKDKIEDYDMYVMCTREKYKELYGKEYEVPTYKNS